MAVSRLLPSGGANDFNLSLGGTYTSVTFNKEYASGSYSITSGVNDSTFDIYAYNTDGSLAGYTKTNSFTASKGFSKMVVLGGTATDVLSFTYKTTFTTVDDSDEVLAGPVATSVSPSSVPNIDDTFTLTGRNFASDCTVTFTSANTAYTATQAKGIVRSSATSLIVTRPDNLPTTYSPYTLTVQNPGITNPTGSNSHILSNAITAGTNPAWVTGATLPAYSKNVAYSTTLVASDTEGSDVDYAVVSGSLPTGLTLDGETGAITGTVTTSNIASYAFTVRATDAGGNFLDRAFTIPNAGPVWVTASGALAEYGPASSYSVQLSATDDGTRTFSVVSGSLPSGLTLSSSGLISGAANSGATGISSFTVRVTDDAGLTADRSFTITSALFIVGNTVTFNPYTSSGQYGPTTAQAQAACTNATVAANLSATNGIQALNTFFPSGTYTVTIAGAKGGDNGGGGIGGDGAQFTTTLTLSGTENLRFIVGQRGYGNQNRSAGGGGGSFIWRANDNTLLVAAAGGGGAAYSSGNRNGVNGSTGTSGTAGRDGGYAGGTGGNGGAGGSGSSGVGGGGGGWLTNGTGTNGSNGGSSVQNGGAGGTGYYSGEHGGFGGGGGGGNYGGGGGGGYSGGGAGSSNDWGGGGGGSYTVGSMSGQQTSSNGFITITRTA